MQSVIQLQTNGILYWKQNFLLTKSKECEFENSQARSLQSAFLQSWTKFFKNILLNVKKTINFNNVKIKLRSSANIFNNVNAVFNKKWTIFKMLINKNWNILNKKWKNKYKYIYIIIYLFHKNYIQSTYYSN